MSCCRPTSCCCSNEGLKAGARILSITHIHISILLLTYFFIVRLFTQGDASRHLLILIIWIFVLIVFNFLLIYGISQEAYLIIVIWEFAFFADMLLRIGLITYLSVFAVADMDNFVDASWRNDGYEPTRMFVLVSVYVVLSLCSLLLLYHFYFVLIVDSYRVQIKQKRTALLDEQRRIAGERSLTTATAAPKPGPWLHPLMAASLANGSVQPSTTMEDNGPRRNVAEHVHPSYPMRPLPPSYTSGYPNLPASEF